VELRPVDPTLGFPLSAILRDMQDAIRELQTPTQPGRLAVVTFANLPPADNWRECAISVSDKNCIAISTSVAGIYTWLRADGTAL
jgi:hypothetical protein